MLATHLGLLLRKMNQLKVQAAALWQQQLNEIQLHENQRKAKEADEQYKKKSADSFLSGSTFCSTSNRINFS